MDIGNKCCFTGYRPSKFPFPLDNSSNEYIKFENALLKTVLDLVDCSVNEFYSGLAMGFDIIAGECVLLAKELKPEADIKLVCAVPFKAQSEAFPNDWKTRYDNLVKNADQTVLTSSSYHKGCYAIRNKFMVDAADTVVTWFDGKSGGTKSTLRYAISKNRKIINLYETDGGKPFDFHFNYYESADDTDILDEEA